MDRSGQHTGPLSLFGHAEHALQRDGAREGFQTGDMIQKIDETQHRAACGDDIIDEEHTHRGPCGQEVDIPFVHGQVLDPARDGVGPDLEHGSAWCVHVRFDAIVGDRHVGHPQVRCHDLSHLQSLFHNRQQTEMVQVREPRSDRGGQKPPEVEVPADLPDQVQREAIQRSSPVPVSQTHGRWSAYGKPGTFKAKRSPALELVRLPSHTSLRTPLPRLRRLLRHSGILPVTPSTNHFIVRRSLSDARWPAGMITFPSWSLIGPRKESSCPAFHLLQLGQYLLLNKLGHRGMEG